MNCKRSSCLATVQNGSNVDPYCCALCQAQDRAMAKLMYDLNVKKRRGTAIDPLLADAWQALAEVGLALDVYRAVIETRTREAAGRAYRCKACRDLGVGGQCGRPGCV